jgi:hypothetical protein
MFSMFVDPANVAKKQVPGNRALRFERGYRVAVDKQVCVVFSDYTKRREFIITS